MAINHRLLTLLYDVVGPMVVYYVLWEVLVYRLPATVVEIAIAYANCWSFICHFSSQRSDNMAKHLFLLMILISIVLALTYQRKPDV